MNNELVRICVLASIAISGNASTVSFSTFVSGADLIAAVGQNNTIGFTYAGNKFVGSVYFGTNNLQLYSTDLTGGSVQPFGSPLPTGGGEVIVAGSLGLAGFAPGSVYAGTGSEIYRYGNTGGAPTLVASGLGGGVRGMLFDPGSSFGGDLLVTTASGNVYRMNSAGVVTLLASTGEDTEGMDVIPVGAPGWGTFGGQLVTASEGSGTMRLISPGGVVTVATGVSIPLFETINFVPMDIGLSGNPLEGYYAANYATDIQKAGASQFAGLQGHLIGTSEYSSSSPVWDIQYLGGASFSASQVGTLPNQAEDGIFVTAQRIQDTVPEPGTWLLMGTGIVCMAWRLRSLKRV